MRASRKADIALWAAGSMFLVPAVIVIGWMFYKVYEKDSGLFFVVLFFLGYLGIMALFMGLHTHYKEKSWYE